MDAEIKRSIILDNYQDAKNRGIPSEDGYIKINPKIVPVTIYIKGINKISTGVFFLIIFFH